MSLYSLSNHTNRTRNKHGGTVREKGWEKGEEKDGETVRARAIGEGTDEETLEVDALSATSSSLSSSGYSRKSRHRRNCAHVSVQGDVTKSKTTRPEAYAQARRKGHVCKATHVF